MDIQIHDLTILFMKKSVNLQDYKNPVDYARKYTEIYQQIENELSDFDRVPPIVSNRL